jgi:hypothetical protein
MAPWTGGTHERLVALVKKCLRNSIGRRLLPLQEWRTAIVEVARCVNSRPIAAMTVDDVSRPLRPIDILEKGEGRSSLELEFTIEDTQDPSFLVKEATSDVMARKFVSNNRLLQQFQTIFREQYLLNLRERHLNKPSSLVKTPRMGDVVLLGQDTKHPQHPAYWRLGRIVQLIYSEDGHARSAWIRVWSPTVEKPTGSRLLKRAINSLYLLDHSSSQPSNGPAEPSSSGLIDFRPHSPAESSNSCSSRSPSPRPNDKQRGQEGATTNARPKRTTNRPQFLQDYHVYSAANVIRNDRVNDHLLPDRGAVDYIDYENNEDPDNRY